MARGIYCWLSKGWISDIWVQIFLDIIFRLWVSFFGWIQTAPAPRLLYVCPKGKVSSDYWVNAMVWMSSNPKRKRVQERVKISWNSRKSKLVNLQYNPNDHKWGIFGCTKCYCYINLYSSDETWTPGHVSWGLLRHFLSILDRFLDHLWWKYWYCSTD